MTTRVLAPACPECGSETQHPLTMLVACLSCNGVGGHVGPGTGESTTVRQDATDPTKFIFGTELLRCSDCDGTGRVLPPPPTDEQIFGRKCERCNGSGSYIPNFPDDPCPLCHGTGRIGAAENRWTCLGGKGVARTGCACYCHDGYDRCDKCKKPEHIEPKYFTCPGRTDIAASPELWAEVKRAWRSRTKTTVLEGYDLSVVYADKAEEGAPAIEIPGVSAHDGGFRYLDEDFMPKQTARNIRGKITVIVTLEPEEEKAR